VTATPTPIHFSGIDAPAEDDLYKCVHCGLCLQVCPTYVELGLETESPRGRLALMKAVSEERLSLTPRLIEHMDLCLQCRACEAACPSGVPFGRVMERTRTQIASKTPQSMKERLARYLGLRLLLSNLGLLRALAWTLKLYQNSGLQWTVRELRLLKPFGPLAQLERQLPKLPRFFRIPRSGVIPARGEAVRRVGMLSGCVMPLTFGPTNEATARVLARNGCEVVLPKAQGCCGALSAHSGEREQARSLARKNIDVFLEAGVEAIIVNSAGCGSAMKEYDELLKDDPAYAEKARRFTELVKDVNEFLAALPIEPPTKELRARVTYQDSCHLVHAQRVSEAPRTLLQSIPGLKLVEMEGADMCCGAAGVYNLTHRELSTRLLDRKMDSVEATEPDIIATANPGCMLQLQMGARHRGLRARVAHVIDLLDEAYED
jgi:glycolate oxidase iron-sulfur subunit